MNLPDQNLEILFLIAALAQLAIAVLNLSLIRIMRWQNELSLVSLLVREVFQVHVYFISIAVATFAVMTWRFAPEIAAAQQPVYIWLSAAMGAFWAIRSIMQWSHYSSTHWRGNGVRTVIHWILFLGYGGLGTLYLIAAGRGFFV